MQNNDDDGHQMAGDITAIRQQLSYLIEDVKAARQEVALLRDEVRKEITAVRTDTAVVISRQNSAIEDVKKKSAESARALYGFIPG